MFVCSHSQIRSRTIYTIYKVALQNVVKIKPNHEYLKKTAKNLSRTIMTKKYYIISKTLIHSFFNSINQNIAQNLDPQTI